MPAAHRPRSALVTTGSPRTARAAPAPGRGRVRPSGRAIWRRSRVQLRVGVERLRVVMFDEFPRGYVAPDHLVETEAHVRRLAVEFAQDVPRAPLRGGPRGNVDTLVPLSVMPLAEQHPLKAERGLL